ncbi:2-hydroxyacid dehydrogenase [Noviherbaspirillum sedimenti]|uniref:Glyoxylate/hydroxypyruvate reductase A n=1 Tax=Noviherbaspirillum sedimenti TaxID=2320865 RepID=A0A3A3FYG9_9BURK|nr:glyoxylate/hydroxypyruvate reductase A [Noviherbaspirillum sedimenti]RJG00671.1 glyoxylate/hydroxypyruvate reductase A [Noviherbaspirillum sedimenti]
MSLLIRSPNPDVIDPLSWKEAIASLMPDLDICVWPDTGDLERVECFLGQRAEAALFKSMTQIKFMQQFAAGADYALSDPAIPPGLLVSRMVDPAMANTMSLFVLAAVLRYHRQLDAYQRQQVSHVWKRLQVPCAQDRTVGVMGLGALGGDLCSKLVALGFKVAGWSRTDKSLPGVKIYQGPSSLDAFLKCSEILVCLLPLTQATRGILNRENLAKMPHGSYLINVARGEHHVVDDVLAALDSGQLAGATIDVHAHDPNPPADESPLWDHPRVAVTPHVATLSSPTSAAAYVVENIRRVRAGLKPLNVIDRVNGY